MAQEFRVHGPAANTLSLFYWPPRMYYRFANLRFECTQCGRCCTGRPGDVIAVNQAEQAAIVRFLAITAAWFKRRYLWRSDDGNDSVRLSDDGRCSFLDKTGKCRVYPVRPVQCRTYPFWPELVASKAAWEKEARACEGIGRGPIVSRERIDAALDQEAAVGRTVRD